MSEGIDPTKADICTLICTRYLETGEGMSRKTINVRFRKPDLLSELVYQDNVIEQSTTAADVLLPRLAAFIVASDPKLLQIVKARLIVVIQAMRELYFSDETSTSLYPWERFVAEARKFDPAIEETALRLGYLLSNDLGVRGGYQQKADATFQAIGVSDRVLTIDDPTLWLDARLQELIPRPRRPMTGTPSATGFGVGESIPPLAVGVRPRAAIPVQFPFMQNPGLKMVVERDYAEMQALDPEITPKAVLIMAGAVIEGLLLDALLLIRRRGFEDFAAASSRPLSDMTVPAKAEGIIKEDRLTYVIRKYRALAHPAREVRDGVAVDERDARLAASAVEVTLREVAEWHRRRGASSPETTQ